MRRSKQVCRLAQELRRGYASGGNKKGGGKSGPPARPPGQQQPAPKAPPPQAAAPKLPGPGMPNRTPPTPGSAPPNKAEGNKWLFSPTFPVDVRLLAAGTLALGGFITYGYFQKVNQAKEQRKLELDLGGDAPAEGSGGGSDGADGGSPGQGSFYEEEVALQPGKSEPADAGVVAAAAGTQDTSPSKATSDEQTEPASPEAVADAEAVATLLNSVLSNQVDLTQAAHEAAASSAELPPAVEEPIPTKEAAQETSAGEVEAEAETSSTGDSDDKKDGGTAAAAAGVKAAAEEKLQETLEVVKEGIATTSGEALASIASSQAKPSKRGEAEAEEGKAETASPEPTPASGFEPQEASQDSRESSAALLGITEPLTPATLMKKAIERGEGSGGDWQEYRMRLAQAASDAQTFEAALEQAVGARQAQLAALEAESHKKDSLVTELESAIKDQAAAFRTVLRREEETAAKQREAELRRQAEYLATAFAEASLKERAVRMQAINEVRMKLNTLSAAFGRRSREQAISHGLHKLSLGVFELGSAVESGQPCGAEARALAESCTGDDLVAAAVSSLPASTEQGLATRAELLDSWPRLRRLTGQLAYIPQGGGGLLQLWLASLAGRLKVQETAPQGSPQTVDQTLALAESLLVGGDLVKAAQVLEHGVTGTAAEAVVAEWAAAAKARAVAEQALRLLQAHASAQEASVS